MRHTIAFINQTSGLSDEDNAAHRWSRLKSRGRLGPMTRIFHRSIVKSSHGVGAEMSTGEDFLALVVGCTIGAFLAFKVIPAVFG